MHDYRHEGASCMGDKIEYIDLMQASYLELSTTEARVL